jgi:hypothetical protein
VLIAQLWPETGELPITSRLIGSSQPMIDRRDVPSGRR